KNALFGLGIFESIRILASYVKAQVMPTPKEENLEEWVSNRFGRRLYEIFFKTYTEKVWGMPCSEITAEWAAQRIKGLSLFTAIRDALVQRQDHDRPGVIHSLINSFHYPRKGPGMMWEAVLELVRTEGGCVA